MDLKVATPLLALVLLAGCASSGETYASYVQRMGASPMTLQSGASPAAAPKGLAEFCLREPGSCNIGPTMQQVSAGYATIGYSATGGAGQSRDALDGSELFRMLLESPNTAVTSPANRLEADLTPELWAMLGDINRQVNWEIQPYDDRALYGRDEFWALPLSRPNGNVGARGDCEDYALEKRERLKAAGVPEAALSLVTAYSQSVGMHAMLMVRTNRGDLLLDNLNDAPVNVGAAPYTFLTMQSGANLLDWSLARLGEHTPAAAPTPASIPAFVPSSGFNLPGRLLAADAAPEAWIAIDLVETDDLVADIEAAFSVALAESYADLIDHLVPDAAYVETVDEEPGLSASLDQDPLPVEEVSLPAVAVSEFDAPAWVVDEGSSPDENVSIATWTSEAFSDLSDVDQALPAAGTGLLLRIISASRQTPAKYSSLRRSAAFLEY